MGGRDLGTRFRVAAGPAEDQLLRLLLSGHLFSARSTRRLFSRAGVRRMVAGGTARRSGRGVFLVRADKTWPRGGLPRSRGPASTAFYRWAAGGHGSGLHGLGPATPGRGAPVPLTRPPRRVGDVARPIGGQSSPLIRPRRAHRPFLAGGLRTTSNWPALGAAGLGRVLAPLRHGPRLKSLVPAGPGRPRRETSFAVYHAGGVQRREGWPQPLGAVWDA